MIAITTVSERMMINTKNKLDQYSIFEKGFFINKLVFHMDFRLQKHIMMTFYFNYNKVKTIFK